MELVIAEKKLNNTLNKPKSKKENVFFCDKSVTLYKGDSIYTQGNGESWDKGKMFKIMLKIAETSLQMLGSDLFKQLTK